MLRRVVMAERPFASRRFVTATCSFQRIHICEHIDPMNQKLYRPRGALLALLLVMLALAGCDAERAITVDCSSDETFDQSLIEMRESLTEAERDELANSMLVLGLVPQQEDETESDASKRFLQRVHGQTAQQIITAAQALRPQLDEDALPEI